MLIVDGISKNFGKKEALLPTSFSLSKGIVGLLGPNGAGKTTLLRLLSTYYTPDTGTITLNQFNWTRNTEAVRRVIGYLPQHSSGFPNLKAKEYLEYTGILRGLSPQYLAKEIPLVLKEVNLEERANDQIKSFSGGMKQRLGIAQAILHQPTLLLVDEPTAGLDPEERIRFRALLKRLGENRLIIISTHITEDVAMTCEQVLLMKAGVVEQYASIQSVVALAKGRVWVLKTDMTTYEQIRARTDVLVTQTSVIEDDNVTLRFIATEPVHPQAESAVPVLEEGYMIWLNRS